MDYRSFIAPFIDFRRAFIKTDSSIRKDINTLNESITFFEQGGFDAPNEAYFEALEAHLLNSLAGTTTKNRISLTRKFFTWTLKGDGHMQEQNTDTITESIDASNEEAPHENFSESNEGTLQALPHEEHEPVGEQEKAPSLPHVDAVKNSEQVMPPQNEGAQTQGKSSTQSKKQSKFTVYFDAALEAKDDIQDLADLDGLPVSKFILKLILQEINNRKDDLAAFRALRAKRA